MYQQRRAGMDIERTGAVSEGTLTFIVYRSLVSEGALTSIVGRSLVSEHLLTQGGWCGAVSERTLFCRGVPVPPQQCCIWR